MQFPLPFWFFSLRQHYHRRMYRQFRPPVNATPPTVNVTPPAVTANVTATPTEVPIEASATTFDGTGNGNVTITVPLAKGANLLTFTQETTAESTVSVETEKDYISVKNTFNEAVSEESMKATMKDGAYYWSQAFMLEEDADATVQVETTGNWTIDFGFPQQINGIVPQTFTGAANKATPFFQINEGTYNFSIIAANNDVVGVHLMDFSGNDIQENDREMPLAFHEGAYDDVVTMKINESNNYLFNVICDGNWTVSVAEA
ncbi:hypothetical protein [Methanogenium cariaci]|uniref:hypothetical protein n=1 Tax=Methanogenium cariaci TaxID=2197 RepID=UPI0012F6379A|nr:hypothetical protein [Methanogenium cariaci]